MSPRSRSSPRWVCPRTSTARYGACPPAPLPAREARGKHGTGERENRAFVALPNLFLCQQPQLECCEQICLFSGIALLVFDLPLFYYFGVGTSTLLVLATAGLGIAAGMQEVRARFSLWLSSTFLYVIAHRP